MSIVATEHPTAGTGLMRLQGAGPDTRGRLLVVEDDADIRDTLSDVLAWEGYDVLTAANGREALELLRRGTGVDAILLDLMMPIMSGWEFRRVQLDDPALSGIPCVVLSASAPGAAQPDRYLAKPFGIEDLLGTLVELLSPGPAPLAA
jgi:CheY-like chemotaxis protein